MIRRTVLLAGLATGILAPLATAQAATVQADLACYIETQAMQIGGSGFGPAAPITLSGDQIALSGSADANGGFLATVKAPLLGTSAPATKTFTITATDGTSGTQASVDVSVATFSFATSTGVKAPSAKRSWTFSGFIQKPGKAIYGHFRHAGKTYANYRFGAPKGPCGTLTKRAPGIPVRRAKSGRWNVQIDYEKTYKRKTSPRLTSSTTVFTTFR